MNKKMGNKKIVISRETNNKAMRFDENSTFSRKKFNKKKGEIEKTVISRETNNDFTKQIILTENSTISRKNVIFRQFLCFFHSASSRDVGDP